MNNVFLYKYRDSGGNKERERGKERDSFFLTDGEIVIGPLNAWIYKSTIADNPLFRINIVAFFSSTGRRIARFK